MGASNQLPAVIEIISEYVTNNNSSLLNFQDRSNTTKNNKIDSRVCEDHLVGEAE